MAAEKTTRRKQRAAREAGEGGSALRTRRIPRKERRYEPRASAVAVISSVVGMSIGAVMLGAGVYGQWLRAEDLGPHKYGPGCCSAGRCSCSPWASSARAPRSPSAWETRAWAWSGTRATSCASSGAR